MIVSRKLAEHCVVTINVLLPSSLFGEEDTTKIRLSNEPASLPENRMERASVDFLIWNRQRLRLAIFENVAKVDVAPSLRNRT